ncbi:sulfotransferase, partial [Microcoleus sp. herbarium19]
MNHHNTAKSDILAIISMHRSGSSLTASLLQSGGLHIGRNLMEGDEKNIKGYYENLDFYDFHRAVLASQGVDENGWTLQEQIEVEDRFREEAKEIVDRASVSGVWGWKEPRTTLFLEFWADLLPQANFLLMYRSPWEVVESLYRQNHGLFKTQPELAVKLWMHYNKKIITFYNHSSSRCLLVNTKTLIQNPAASIEAINQKFKLHLAPPDAKIYDPSLFRSQGLDSYRPSLIESQFPEAVNLYQELDARAWFPENTPDLSWRELIKPSPYRVWAFRDWVNVCKLEKENKKLCSQLEQLEQSQSQLQQTEGLLEQSQSQLQQTEGLLEQSQSQLHQTQALLSNFQSQLQQTEGLLEQSQSQLQQTEGLLEQSQPQLHPTEDLLEQSQSQLQQTEGLLEQFQALFYQTQAELEASQSHLQQTEVLLEQFQAQFYQAQVELEASKSQLQHSHREIEQTKCQVDETETLLKQSQSQLQQTESSLGICMSQLLETRAELEISQGQHHETQRKLKRSQSQHHKIQEELEQSQSQQHQTEALLEEYESQLHHTQQELEQLQSQYHQTEALLEEYESQLYQTQQELEQSQSQQQKYESQLNQ